MKNILVILLITFFLNIGYLESQNNYKAEILIEKEYGGQIFSTDLIFDKSDNIYFFDGFRNILKYDRNGNFLYDIPIPIEQFNSVKLGIDFQNNLYVSLMWSDYFSQMLKFDSSGNQIKNFELKNPKPAGRTYPIFISKSNKLYIYTFLLELEPSEWAKGYVYVYNIDGKFLGRTDYYVENSDGMVYKIDPGYKEFRVEQFDSTPRNEITKSDSLEHKGRISIEYKYRSYEPGSIFGSEEDSWGYIDLDKNNNIYFANPFMIKKYDKTNSFIENINISIKKLDKSKIFAHIHFLKVNNEGEIFVYGFKNYDDSFKDNDKIVILKYIK